ncbi:hypothetical protein PILCRDRAFT_16981 [Piloderma croceum F 1598]|uniref:DUF6589 domain-containing protein n=1 Tax=Piloderma croceum (strain F 1598) TaxID=765440 RepID=A0A0C3EFU8_PILCF|nr:hypothetical protein PILCRDRAFT_16981 [Piloderma croceum F 1598]
MSSQARRVEKIHGVTDALKTNGWRSVNDFLLAFYTSNDPIVSQQAQRNLSYTAGQSFAPEKILDAWLDHGPSGESRDQLHLAITRKAAKIMIKETDKAYHQDELRISSSKLDIPYLTTEFGLKKMLVLYQTVLLCLWLLLSTILAAQNDYEKKTGREKEGKEEMIPRVTMVIISMLLFMRNRATDAFQLVMGLFLSSAGASCRLIDTFNHVGICVSYQTVQRALVSLSKSSRERAINFIRNSERLYMIVYDNINFTLRKTSQRLDSATHQINATTLAVVSLPMKFTRAAYAAALSVSERNKKAGLRNQMKLDDLKPMAEQQRQLADASKHNIRMILLEHTPGIGKHKKLLRRLRKKVKEIKPRIRILECERTEFFPLPALNEEEASVQGTIKVVISIFTRLLEFAAELEERKDEFLEFQRLNWVQEASMPFHFQLNAVYMICRTHLGFSGDNDPSSLEHHRTILRRSKLDPKKPEYNKAKELVMHSLIARIIDCTWIILEKPKSSHLKKWKPNWEEFNRTVTEIWEKFATMAAAHDALEAGDEVLAHSILFIRDALLFREFCEAIRDADVGRMWTVYDFWVFMMRGAGCHNYGNEILEMKAQFKHEFPPLLQEVIERTWLVNRWGTEGRSIPTDLYLEHNNGFTKNMFAAMGSCASFNHVCDKSSACVEVLLSIDADIKALCVDLAAQNVHSFTSNRKVPPPPPKKTAKVATTKPRRRKPRKTGVRDVLLDGMVMLSEKGLFEHWMLRTGQGGTDIYGTEVGEVSDEITTETAFDDPNGTMEVDTGVDLEFEAECPFSNVHISTEDGDN